MDSDNSDDRQRSVMPASSLCRLFLVAVGVPGVVVVADTWAMQFVRQQDWSALGMGVLYALFVSQVGLLGMVVGRFVERWFLRWFVLVWGLVLIDLMLICITVDQPYRWRDWGYCLPYALLSGQLGLVAIWGILGPVSWPWRLPGFLVAAMLVTSFGFALENRGGVWALLAVMQGLATVGLCILLWCFGLRMRLPGDVVRGDEPAGNKVFQFSIGHMLLWTLALVPILLLAQGLDLGFVYRVSLWEWLGLLLVALGLGVVSLIAIWAALGRGWAAIRISTLAVVPALLAFVPALVGLLVTFMFESRGLGRWDYITYELAEIVWGWVAWTLLVAWFLAGLLLMFRASGYRLVRAPRPSGTGPAAEGISSG